jgi:transposase
MAHDAFEKLTRAAFEREEQRRQVLALHKKGKGYGKIAQELEIGKSTVQKIIKVFKGRGNACEKRRGGRHSKLDFRCALRNGVKMG